VFNLTSLETLILDNCGLETLSEAIGQLDKLIQLTLTLNQLKSLPQTISQLKNLHSFDVNNNPSLTSLDVLNGLSLPTLIATNCSIDHLPRNLTHIVVFNLSNNKLPRSNHPARNRPVSAPSAGFMEAVFQTGIHRKRSVRFRLYREGKP
jgi:Leucine-rich repeat (LRR) protein